MITKRETIDQLLDIVAEMYRTEGLLQVSDLFDSLEGKILVGSICIHDVKR